MELIKKASVCEQPRKMMATEPEGAICVKQWTCLPVHHLTHCKKPDASQQGFREVMVKSSIDFFEVMVFFDSSIISAEGRHAFINVFGEW